ncbi:MAG: phosphate signaling complex protein PhoU [Elusimicrobiota bacterium]|jgi:phosphate transport system protein|nr:phosphate signaling complex protein PhoU [Elusimicrobiota bacterium]
MRHFDVEIKDLQNHLINMASIVQNMINAATQSLSNKNQISSGNVLSLEKEVNIQEIVIDDKCLKLIALNQPVGADLRFITSAMKINSDLERMGDEAVNINNKTCDLEKIENCKPFETTQKMVAAVQTMVMDSIKAFNTSDIVLAQSVLKKDDEVDDLNDSVLDDIKTLLANTNNPEEIQTAIDLIFISKSIERLGDHATNISEDVIFMINGKDVRHPKLKQKQ